MADFTRSQGRSLAFIEATTRAFGRLDLLFNNAGTGAPAVPLEDLTVEQWRRVIDVNLTGAFLRTREAFRLMKVSVLRIHPIRFGGHPALIAIVPT